MGESNDRVWGKVYYHITSTLSVIYTSFNIYDDTDMHTQYNVIYLSLLVLDEGTGVIFFYYYLFIFLYWCEFSTGTSWLIVI